MYRYLPIEERLHSDELGPFFTFGISVVNSHGNEIDRISDVSTSRPAVDALCSKCTKLHLHPIHLRDVIDDFLAEI